MILPVSSHYKEGWQILEAHGHQKKDWTGVRRAGREELFPTRLGQQMLPHIGWKRIWR